MTKEEAKEKYEELFPGDKEKAEAFNKIAELYYYQNFGSVQKSDFDVLMFSLYLERILESNGDNYSEYSDYKLSKLLGITQSRVGSLKVKKELKYPHNKFNWKESFSRVFEKATYENGKIRVYIPDKNLFIELKNVIEEDYGIVDIQLNSKVLQVDVKSFVNLLYHMSEEDDKEKITKGLKEILKKNSKENKQYIAEIEKKSFVESLKEGWDNLDKVKFVINFIETVFVPTSKAGTSILKICKKFIGLISEN